MYIFILWTGFVCLPSKGYAEGNYSMVKADTIKKLVIFFDSGESHVDSLYQENGNTIALLDAIASEWFGADGLVSVSITSFVSPDGDMQTNKSLAEKRNESVKELLRQRYSFQDENKIKVSPPEENWQDIRNEIVAHAEMPDREEVLMLIDYPKHSISKRKQLLKKLDTGVPYRYMVREIFPRLRRTEVVIERKVVAEAAEVLQVEARVAEEIPVPPTEETEEEAVPEPEMGWMETTDEPQAETVDGKEDSRILLAVKNNLLYDLALAPNVEVEIPVGKRWSLNAEYKCPWWLNNSHEFCYQLLSGGVEARIWLGERLGSRVLSGHFLGVYAEGGIYDFQFKGDGYQGKYYGASGVTYGYAKRVARHLSFEFSLGIGYLTTEYRKYTPYEGDIVWTKSGRYNFIGPTKAKVSLVWLITKRR